MNNAGKIVDAIINFMREHPLVAVAVVVVVLWLIYVGRKRK